jgi:hypothetical protein
MHVLVRFVLLLVAESLPDLMALAMAVFDNPACFAACPSVNMECRAL